jgi:hypothetical protein
MNNQRSLGRSSSMFTLFGTGSEHDGDGSLLDKTQHLIDIDFPAFQFHHPYRLL